MVYFPLSVIPSDRGLRDLSISFMPYVILKHFLNISMTSIVSYHLYQEKNGWAINLSPWRCRLRCQGELALLCGDVVHCMSNTGLRLLEKAVQCGNDICTEPVAAAARHLQTTSDQPTQQRVSNQPVSKLRVWWVGVVFLGAEGW